ncbi:hypothetical protein [uncultured Herbaspirillum sp.]|uniref:hypothetical protein n=1 Tax=uncultured Herbaspirillum sp. TaxID=160236 RepID=UPI00258A3264|nr:hypothetical protein [uncultured Herbaspirillum sp.]
MSQQLAGDFTEVAARDNIYTDFIKDTNGSGAFCQVIAIAVALALSVMTGGTAGLAVMQACRCLAPHVARQIRSYDVITINILAEAMVAYGVPAYLCSEMVAKNLCRWLASVVQRADNAKPKRLLRALSQGYI